MKHTEESKIILITGANKGIGYETARALAIAGHTVLMGARDPERGQAAADALAVDGLQVRPVELDVTDEQTIRSAAELIAGDYGRLDILINNAAITRDAGRVPAEVPLADLRAVYETNALGPVAMIN